MKYRRRTELDCVRRLDRTRGGDELLTYESWIERHYLNDTKFNDGKTRKRLRGSSTFNVEVSPLTPRSSVRRGAIAIARAASRLPNLTSLRMEIGFLKFHQHTMCPKHALTIV